MRCANGTDTGDTCFSDAQIAAIEKIASPVQFSFTFAGGYTTFPKWPIFEGATFLGNTLGRSDTADLNNLPGTNAFVLLPSTGAVRGFITQNLSADPLAFDPNQWVTRI